MHSHVQNNVWFIKITNLHMQLIIWRQQTSLFTTKGKNCYPFLTKRVTKTTSVLSSFFYGTLLLFAGLLTGVKFPSPDIGRDQCLNSLCHKCRWFWHIKFGSKKKPSSLGVLKVLNKIAGQKQVLFRNNCDFPNFM